MIMSAPSRPAAVTPEPDVFIARALEKCLEKHRVSRVLIAGGTVPPPQMADMVGFARLSVVLSGSYEVELEQDGRAELHRLAAGEAVFVPANCWDRPTWKTPTVMVTFLMGKRQTGISLVEQRHASTVPTRAVKAHVDPPQGAESCILDGILALSRDAGDRTPGDVLELLVEALLRCYLKVLLSPKVKGIGGKADRTFRNLCLYIEENFRLPITRESAAEHFGLSPNHVSRLFHDHGVTKFNDFLNRVRIERAKVLLKHRELTVADVATNSGFSDSAYFCRVFRQRAGMTPGEYRAHHA